MLVGCGQQKRQTDGPVPAEDLYTSSYFTCKRRYAEARSYTGTDAPDGTPSWMILSAKYDILYPSLKVEPYDRTIEDLAADPAPVSPEAYQHTRYPWDEPLYETRLDFWSRRVHFGLASWLGFKSGFPEEDPHCDELIVLAGDRYVEPLLQYEVFEPFPWDVTLPFQELSFDGIGEQMAWLAEEADRYEDEALGQTELDNWEPEDWQADLDHWTD